MELFNSLTTIQLVGAFRAGRALLVTSVGNPIHSILLLIRVFFLGTVLLFSLNREYLAILFLIVYVGAIVVLFLFIIRRLERKRGSTSRRFRDLFSYRYLVVGLLFLQSLLLLNQDAFDLPRNIMDSTSTRENLRERNGTVNWASLIHRTDTLRAFGGVLYTEYRTSLFLAALLLFLSRVGAIAVTLVIFSDPTSEDEETTGKEYQTRKRQNRNFQRRRHPMRTDFVI